MILIADSRLQCRQTLGLVWSNELLMGGNSHAHSPRTNSVNCAPLGRPHTQDTRQAQAAHFINIKPEKQAKNV